MCKYCEQKYDKAKWEYENRLPITDGSWVAVYMGVDNTNKLYILGAGEDYTDKVYINYCPFCGKKVNKITKSNTTGNRR